MTLALYKFLAEGLEERVLGYSHSSHKSNDTKSHQPTQSFSVYLARTTAPTRAMLASPSSVHKALVFTWPGLKQQQKQCQPVLPVYTKL